jgi:hypothetical protein
MHTKIMNPASPVIKYFLDRNVWDRKVLCRKECYCHKMFFLSVHFCYLFCFQEVLFVTSYTNGMLCINISFPLTFRLDPQIFKFFPNRAHIHVVPSK